MKMFRDLSLKLSEDLSKTLLPPSPFKNYYKKRIKYLRIFLIKLDRLSGNGAFSLMISVSKVPLPWMRFLNQQRTGGRTGCSSNSQERGWEQNDKCARPGWNSKNVKQKIENPGHKDCNSNSLSSNFVEIGN